jgi:hypothetical protein
VVGPTENTELVERDLIVSLAREQVAEIAPHELPLFRPTSEAYFKHPEEVARARGGEGDVLGFGAGGAVTFITPIVLAVVSEVVSYLVNELRNQLKTESSSAISTLVKGLFRRLPHGQTQESGGAKSPPALSGQQLERVRARALETAKRLGLPDPQAITLADALTGSLVLSV